MRFAILLILAASASAQTFERFGVREGLPSELINDVALGPDGMLWIGTDDGLARYDGHRFRTWRGGPGEVGALPSSRVFAVTPTANGAWVGTSRGPAFLDLRTGLTAVPEGLPRGNVSDIVEDVDGDLWVGYVGNGLWKYSPSSGAVVRAQLGQAEQVKYSRVVALARDGEHIWTEVYRGEDSGGPKLCRLDRERATCGDVLSSIDWRVMRDGGQAVLVRKERPEGGGWIVWLDGERWTFESTRVLDYSYRTLVRLGPDRAWVRSESALVEVRSDGSFTRIDAAPGRRGGLGGYDARALTRDRQGNIWVGTEAGLYFARLPSRLFDTFVHSDDDRATLSDDRVNGMSQDSDGTLWVATNDGLNRVDVSSGSVDRISAVLDDVFRRDDIIGAFWQVLVLGDGRILAGSKRAGLFELRSGSLRPVAMAGTGQQLGIRALTQDRNGRVWVSTNSGLWSGQPGAFRREQLPGDLRPVNIAFEDQSGRLWLGSDDGLYHREADGSWRPVARGLLCAPVTWSMTESDADPGALWLATVGGGLARLDTETETIECVTARDGLPTNSVYGVVSDAEGALWASTTTGLARVDPATRRVATFSAADGLAGEAFNLMAQLRLADGRLAFGGPSGLTIVDPQRVESRPAPDVVITGVEREGRLLAGIPGPDDDLRLSYGTNGFGVRFGAADFRAPWQTRYRYRLIGFDDDWQTTDGSAPRATYTALPPGRYQFEVQAAASDTRFSEQPARLSVLVVPAVWQRRSIQSGSLLLVLALAGTLIGVRNRRQKAERARAQDEASEVRRRLADARERERTRLARDLHDGPIQNLYRVGHDLDQIQASQASDVRPVRQRVGAVAGELRQMLTELRPTLIEHLGLGAALRVASRTAESRFPNLRVDVRDETRTTVGADSALALFRIAQEAVQNAGRHAGTAHVLIRLSDDDEGIALTVKDDGLGFTLPDRIDLARSEHFGLIGAQERAEAVGGTLSVESRPGAGTAVRAWVPRDAEPETAP